MFDLFGWGATLAMLGLGAGGLGLAILYFRRQGAKRERARQAEANRKAVERAGEIHDDVYARPPKDNRRRLKEW